MADAQPTPVQVSSVPARLKAQNCCAEYAGHGNTTWAYRLDENEAYELTLDPPAWSPVIARWRGMRAGDLIHVRNFDNSFFAELFVRATGENWLRAVENRKHDHRVKSALPANVPLQRKWNVGKKTYDIVRKDDGAVLASGLKTVEDADAWIKDHLQKLAA